MGKHEGKIIAYTREGCAESVRLKQTLERISPEVLEISLSRYPSRISELQRLNIGPTPCIPCAVFNDQVIGGVDKLDELEASGQLREMVNISLSTVHFETRVPVSPQGYVEADTLRAYSEKQLELDLLISRMKDKVKGVPRKRLKLRKARAGKVAGSNGKCFRVGDAMEWIQAKHNLEKEQTQVLFKDLYDAGHFATVDNVREAGRGMNTFLTFQSDLHPFHLNKSRIFNGVARPANVIAVEMLRTVQQIIDVADNKKLDLRGDSLAISKLPETMLFMYQSLELQQADLADIAGEAMLATFLNLHNCLAFHTFLEVGVPKTALQQTKYRNTYCYSVGKESFTLDDMLHGILRCNKRQSGKSKSQFSPGDSRLRLCASGRLEWNNRIHFGLAKITSVPVPPLIFREETVLDDLEWLAYAFCGRNVRVDMEEVQVELPELFETYLQDFARSENHLLRFLAEYIPTESATHLRALLKLTDAEVVYTKTQELSTGQTGSSPRPDSTSVDFSNSNMETLPPFSNWEASKVQILNLARNSFIEIPESFSQFSSLTRLFLSHNQLTDLPTCLGDIRTLGTLDVSYNNLTALPLCVGRLENLKNLYMSSNFISTLPDTVKSLPVLKSLNIAGNLLGVLPEWIADSLPVLEQLDASSNQISKMPSKLPASLLELYLNNNRLAQLERDIFQNSAALEVLDLSHNQLTMLPSGMQRLKALVTLNVANNRLTSVQIARRLPALNRIYCMRNPLTDLPASVCLSASGPIAYWKKDMEMQINLTKSPKSPRVTPRSPKRAVSGPAHHKLVRHGSTITDLIMTGSASSVPRKSKAQLSTLNLRELMQASMKSAAPPLKRMDSDESEGSEDGSLGSADREREKGEKGKGKGRVPTRGRKRKSSTRTPSFVFDTPLDLSPVSSPTSDDQRGPLLFRTRSLDGLIAACEGFNREDGSARSRFHDAEVESQSMGCQTFASTEFVLAPTEFVYLSSFKGNPHTTFVADDPNYGYVIASVLHEPVERQMTNVWEPSFYYTALVHCIQGTKVCCMPQESRIKKKNIVKGLQRITKDHLGISRLMEVNNDAFETLLLELEERICVANHKLGVLFIKPGQKEEEEFYGNQHGSEDFEKFLSLLGAKVPLLKWTGFNGGLDTVGDRTGTHMIYTESGSSNIVFHVSTYLPFKATDPQQLERKKHIGNDVVVIVFADSEEVQFDPTSIASQFNSVFIVVCKDPSSTDECTKYRVNVASKAAIGIVKPYLPSEPVFDEPSLRAFLLDKALHAEQAAWTHMPTFASAIKRARAIYLEEIFDDLSCTGKFKNKFGRKKSI